MFPSQPKPTSRSLYAVPSSCKWSLTSRTSVLLGWMTMFVETSVSAYGDTGCVGTLIGRARATMEAATAHSNGTILFIKCPPAIWKDASEVLSATATFRHCRDRGWVRACPIVRAPRARDVGLQAHPCAGGWLYKLGRPVPRHPAGSARQRLPVEAIRTLKEETPLWAFRSVLTSENAMKHLPHFAWQGGLILIEYPRQTNHKGIRRAGFV